MTLYRAIRRRYWPSPLDVEMDKLRASVIAINLTLRDSFTPAIKRTAIAFELFDARVGHKWNRHQMICDRGDGAPFWRG